MNEESRQILEMLQRGQISAEEAMELLDAVESSAGVAPDGGPAQRPRHLRIVVTDTRSGRVMVNMNVPFSLVDAAARFGLTLGIKRAPELAKVDVDQVVSAIRSGVQGKLVDAVNEEESQRVTISVE